MIRATSDSRVSSPNAAKTDARARVIAGCALGLTGDIGLDAFQLLCPSVVIHAERFQAAVAWKFVESRFRDAQQRSPPQFSRGGTPPACLVPSSSPRQGRRNRDARYRKRGSRAPVSGQRPQTWRARSLEM